MLWAQMHKEFILSLILQQNLSLQLFCIRAGSPAQDTFHDFNHFRKIADGDSVFLAFPVNNFPG